MPTSLRPPALLAGVLLLLLSAVAPLRAQAPRPARLQGTVFDSLKARPLAGATVTVMQVSPAPQQYFTAVTDSAGRFMVDSLVAGQYRVDFTTPFLDSLELQFPQREVTLGAGEQGRADFATPSRATLAAAACPGLTLAKGRGAIVGQVMNAETETPLGGATIVVSWADLGVDLKAMRAVAQERTAAVVTDSLGRYRVCGLPTDTYIVLQIQQQRKAGTPLRTLVGDDAGVMVQNLSLSAAAARDFAAADAGAAPVRDTVARLLTGTASVAGVVRSADGAPMPDAQVRVMDAAGSARSDATGAFTLGGLPAGTQMLEVRRIGYLIAQQPVELRAGRTVTASVRLTRIVTLDSVQVVAQRTRLEEFERRAARGTAAGSILRATDLEKMTLSETADIFRGRILGFATVGDGLDAKIRSTRGQSTFAGPCDVNIVIDGMQHQDINLVRPQSIAGMEVYRGAAGAPPEYDSFCGVIVIWTKR